MSEENNLNKENDKSNQNISELHSNQTTNETKKNEGAPLPNRSTSLSLVIKKALPLALGMATIGIIITVVLYMLLK
jgi:hypothetical protein